MSLQNNITPDEIVAAIKALPPMPHLCGNTPAAERAHRAMTERGPRARQARIVVYRYDGTGRGREICDKVQAGLQSGTLPFHDICAALNADVQLIELGAGAHTRDDTARAAAFGMMATEEDTGLLVVAAFGADAAPNGRAVDFFDSVTPDTGALLGAIVAGARAGIPVIAEGQKAVMAAQALYALRPDLCQKLFLCGVPASFTDERFAIFADDKPDHPAYAGAALAALFTSQYGQVVAA